MAAENLGHPDTKITEPGYTRRGVPTRRIIVISRGTTHLCGCATDETLAGLKLPDGVVTHGADGRLIAWQLAPGTHVDAAELWLTSATQFPDTGLWPIFSGWPVQQSRAWCRTRAEDAMPYWRDPYAVPADVYAAVDTADRQHYFSNFEDEPDSFQHVMSCFGLTETEMTLAEPSQLPDNPLGSLVVPRNSSGMLALVACRRPADAVLLLDFGVANADATPGIFTGVLRSWETRFGVVPVMLDPAWTSFQVLAPPTTDLQIDRLASEVFSFATDTATQGGFHSHSVDETCGVRELVQSREWLIWWD